MNQKRKSFHKNKFVLSSKSSTTANRTFKSWK
jgi:hypothetical protein